MSSKRSTNLRSTGATPSDSNFSHVSTLSSLTGATLTGSVLDAAMMGARYNKDNDDMRLKKAAMSRPSRVATAALTAKRPTSRGSSREPRSSSRSRKVVISKGLGIASVKPKSNNTKNTVRSSKSTSASSKDYSTSTYTTDPNSETSASHSTPSSRISEGKKNNKTSSKISETTKSSSTKDKISKDIMRRHNRSMTSSSLNKKQNQISSHARQLTSSTLATSSPSKKSKTPATTNTNKVLTSSTSKNSKTKKQTSPSKSDESSNVVKSSKHKDHKVRKSTKSPPISETDESSASAAIRLDVIKECDAETDNGDEYSQQLQKRRVNDRRSKSRTKSLSSTKSPKKEESRDDVDYYQDPPKSPKHSSTDGPVSPASSSPKNVQKKRVHRRKQSNKMEEDGEVVAVSPSPPEKNGRTKTLSAGPARISARKEKKESSSSPPIIAKSESTNKDEEAASSGTSSRDNTPITNSHSTNSNSFTRNKHTEGSGPPQGQSISNLEQSFASVSTTNKHIEDSLQAHLPTSAANVNVVHTEESLFEIQQRQLVQEHNQLLQQQQKKQQFDDQLHQTDEKQSVGTPSVVSLISGLPAFVRFTIEPSQTQLSSLGTFEDVVTTMINQMKSERKAAHRQIEQRGDTVDHHHQPHHYQEISPAHHNPELIRNTTDLTRTVRPRPPIEFVIVKNQDRLYGNPNKNNPSSNIPSKPGSPRSKPQIDNYGCHATSSSVTSAPVSFMKDALCCIFQPTNNTSKTPKTDELFHGNKEEVTNHYQLQQHQHHREDRYPSNNNFHNRIHIRDDNKNNGNRERDMSTPIGAAISTRDYNMGNTAALHNREDDSSAVMFQDEPVVVGTTNRNTFEAPLYSFVTEDEHFLG